jgi:hypothetical protein
LTVAIDAWADAIRPYYSTGASSKTLPLCFVFNHPRLKCGLTAKVH